MGRGENRSPRWAMNVATFIPLLGRNAQKQVEALLDCSPRQARRVVDTGRVPGPLQARALQLMRYAVIFAQQKLEDAEREISEMDYQAMAGRIEARRLAENRRFALEAHRPNGPEQPALTLGDAE